MIHVTSCNPVAIIRQRLKVKKKDPTWSHFFPVRPLVSKIMWRGVFSGHLWAQGRCLHADCLHGLCCHPIVWFEASQHWTYSYWEGPGFSEEMVACRRVHTYRILSNYHHQCLVLQWAITTPASAGDPPVLAGGLQPRLLWGHCFSLGPVVTRFCVTIESGVSVCPSIVEFYSQLYWPSYGQMPWGPYCTQTPRLGSLVALQLSPGGRTPVIQVFSLFRSPTWHVWDLILTCLAHPTVSLWLLVCLWI